MTERPDDRLQPGDIIFCAGCQAYWKLLPGEHNLPVVVEVVTDTGPDWRLFCPNCVRKLDSGKGVFPND